MNPGNQPQEEASREGQTFVSKRSSSQSEDEPEAKKIKHEAHKADPSDLCQDRVRLDSEFRHPLGNHV